MLKNNYFEIEKDLDEGFKAFIDYGKADNFTFEKRNNVYQLTKNEQIQYIGLQADGKVNPTYYDNAKKKVLILLYESYRNISDKNLDYIWNLAGRLKKGLIGPYDKVNKWIEEINQELELGFDKGIDAIQYCAVMNISKIARTETNVDSRVLNACVRPKNSKRKFNGVPCCGERLAEQFLFYDPDIIVCGNTRRYMEKFLETGGIEYKIIDMWKGEEQTKKGHPRLNAYKYEINGKEVLLFHAYHPSAGRGNDTQSENFKNIMTKNNLQI